MRGAGPSTRYVEAVPRFVYPLRVADESRVWARVVERVPRLAALGGDDRALVTYAFTEMVNNAIEHSGGETLTVVVAPAPGGLRIRVEDDGEGAFEHARRRFGLAAPIEAIGEISKGRRTTDPERHAGEGIFFTSKAVSRFSLHAGDLEWIVDNRRGDQAVRSVEPRRGTAVTLEVDLPVRRPLAAVFAEYTQDDAFTRTRTVVRLFEVGGDFVSRSEARRLLSGLEVFREVVLDFTGVAGVGQGFADEVFRVWARAHPEVRLTPDAMNPAVSFMVRRALAG